MSKNSEDLLPTSRKGKAVRQNTVTISKDEYDALKEFKAAVTLIRDSFLWTTEVHQRLIETLSVVVMNYGDSDIVGTTKHFLKSKGFVISPQAKLAE